MHLIPGTALPSVYKEIGFLVFSLSPAEHMLNDPKKTLWQKLWLNIEICLAATRIDINPSWNSQILYIMASYSFRELLELLGNHKKARGGTSICLHAGIDKDKGGPSSASRCEQWLLENVQTDFPNEVRKIWWRRCLCILIGLNEAKAHFAGHMEISMLAFTNFIFSETKSFCWCNPDGYLERILWHFHCKDR